MTSCPCAFVALRGSSAGERAYSAIASVSSGTPTPVFELVKKTGISVPAATALESAAEISCGVSCCPFEVAFHQRFVRLDDRVHHRLIPFLRIGNGLRRHRRGDFERADDAAEFGTQADGQIHRHAGVAERFPQRVENAIEIEVIQVAFVHDDHPADSLLTSQVERSPRVHFDPGAGAQHDDRGFHGAQTADHLTDEVRIARRVDHVDVFAGVREMNDGRRERVLVVLGLFIRIEDAGAVIDRTGSTDGSGFEQQEVGQRRFPDGSVPDQCHVADVRDLVFGHKRMVPGR